LHIDNRSTRTTSKKIIEFIYSPVYRLVRQFL